MKQLTENAIGSSKSLDVLLIKNFIMNYSMRLDIF